MYQPHLFIGIGETHAYFTLRESKLIYIPSEGSMGNAVVNGVYQGSTIESSDHIVNLSQDPTEAWEKATSYAANMGMELRGSLEKMSDDMREIKRMSADEARERQERLAKIEYDRLEALRQWDRNAREMIDNGIMPFGRFRDCKIEEIADVGYLSWMANATFDADSIQAYLAKAINDRYQHKLLPKAHPTLYVGIVGERRNFSVTVIRNFRVQSMYGTLCIVSMVNDETGAYIISKSTSFSAETGDKLTFKATVKAHHDYKGQAQTVVQRIKVLT